MSKFISRTGSFIKLVYKNNHIRYINPKNVLFIDVDHKQKFIKFKTDLADGWIGGTELSDQTMNELKDLDQILEQIHNKRSEITINEPSDQINKKPTNKKYTETTISGSFNKSDLPWEQ